MLALGAVLLALFVVPSPWGPALVALAAAVDLAETVVLVRWSRRLPPVVGIEALVGRTGVATTLLAPTGRVRLDGALWAARLASGAPGPLEPGADVVVERIDGAELVVRARRSTDGEGLG